MVQSLVNRLEKINETPDFIVFDECHHASSNSYLKIQEKYPDAFILGLTATATRLSGKPLKDVFDVIVSDVQASELIKLGFLANYDYYAPKINADFSTIKIRAGDYSAEEVEIALDKQQIYGDIIANYKKYAAGRKTIIYCAGIAYSKKIEQKFNDAGYRIKHFDGTTKKEERDKIIDDFRNNRIDILTNVDLVGEGFDVPDCDCCLLLRPTQSLALYIQQSTRCLRPQENKRAVIIDFVGNAFRHGMPTEDRDWDLQEGKKCKNKNGERDVLVRECRQCFKCYLGISAICPYCGFDNGKTRKELEEEKRAELEKIEKIERQKKKNEVKGKTYEELVAIGYARGYKNPEYWARVRTDYKENKMWEKKHGNY